MRRRNAGKLNPEQERQFRWVCYDNRSSRPRLVCMFWRGGARWDRILKDVSPDSRIVLFCRLLSVGRTG